MRAHRTIGSICACLLAGSVLAPNAGATLKTVVAGEAGTQATLTYDEGKDSFGDPTFSQENLTIARAGTTYYRQPVRSRYCSSGCWVESVPETLVAVLAPLAVKDLDGDAQPDVVLDLYTGGAHCCSIVQVYEWDPGLSTYRVLERDFGDPGAQLTDVAGNGRYELESADDRFAYEFTSYAYSGLPLQIWGLREGRLLDVTRSFGQAIAADAKRQWDAFLANRRQGYGLGAIAAWAADEYLLGHRRAVAKRLAREARAHRLRSRDKLSPTGSAFVAKLKRFLIKAGYA